MNNSLRPSDNLVSKHIRMGNFTFKGKMVCLALAMSFVFGIQLSSAQGKQKPTQQQLDKMVDQAGGISFIENKGQWPASVLYHVDVPGGQMVVTPEGMLMGQYDAASFAAVEAYDMKLEEARSKHKPAKELGKAPTLKGHAWKFNFIGGSKANMSTIEKGGESNDYFNFLGYNGTDVTNAHGYTKLTYKNVYPNIDVKYYTSASGSLENDVVIKPGADGNLVKIAIDGIDNLKMNAKGELILPTTVGDITVTKPVSYLIDADGNKTEIEVKYVLTGKNTLSFNIPAYDKTKTLVIDPIVMRWATWVTNNSSADGHNHGIDVDASGNIYVTGKAAMNLIVTAGAFQIIDSGSFNVFVGKYLEPVTPGTAGTRVWQTYFGSHSSDIPYVLTIGTDGFLYIAGTTSGNLQSTYGTGFAGQATWTQRICNDVIHQQAFIAKVSAAGTGALVREIGPATNDCEPALFDLRLLSTGTGTFDLVAVGYVTEKTNTADGDIPTTNTPAGTAKLTTGDLNGYALRITSNLQTISWTKQITSSGNNSDNFNIALVDASGNIYIGGSTQGSSGVSFNNPSTQNALVGFQDGWLLKLNSSGTCLWSRYFNSATASDDATILCMEFNQQKTSFVVGGITSSLASSNIITGSYHTAYYGGNFDFFVCALPVSGASTTWGTYFGGSSDETNMMGLNLDQNNDVYVLGYSTSKNIPVPSTNFPVQNATYDPTNSDGIFFKIHSDGTTLDYSTYLGGTSDDFDPIGQKGIKFANCRIYLAMTSESKDFPLTQGTITPRKYSATSIYEPLLISMANPPDLAGNDITSAHTQSIICGSSPQPITAGIPSYNIARIIRDSVLQTNGTSGAYPNGAAPLVFNYQWQQSLDLGVTWTNIAGATSQNFNPSALNIIGTTEFRRVINGDACQTQADTLGYTIVCMSSDQSGLSPLKLMWDFSKLIN